jgi:alpha,alpha-trehalose phosphorylase
VLTRELEWVSPAGHAIRIRTTRLVSFEQRAIAAVSYEVEPLNDPARIVLQSSLVANEPMPQHSDDPRAAAALSTSLVSDYHSHNGLEASLGHHTRLSELRLAAGLDHIVEGPQGTLTHAESWPDLARVTVSTELMPGERLEVVKLLAYGWSVVRSMPALRDQVDAALAAAKRTGWEGLLSGQRRYLDGVWDRADVEVDGDPELQQAVRFGVFQVVQAGARAEQRAIPAKGLTGRGYDGHTFWDMETYVLPVLTYTLPEAARDALHWRHSTLALARDRARELRLKGASFPWRTISGKECSGYWPAGTAAFHINADIADASRRYVFATLDTDFESGPGLDLLVETARLWAALGHMDAGGKFRIDGVTGPDEYSALADNNTFTNLMAARNLRAAADVARRYPGRAAELEVLTVEIDAWAQAASAIAVPFDNEIGVTSQSEGFTRYRAWDFSSMRAQDYPLLLHFPYYLLYSSQVVKQADLVLALYLCGDRFGAEQKAKDFDYYEAITVRDSSLSASIQAIVAAEVGHMELACDYFRESAFVDLRDLAGNTAEGLHVASLAGAWLAAVAGFGGMRDHDDILAFAPRLPEDLNGLSFRLRYRGRCIRVDLGHHDASYQLLDGDELELLHHGERFRLSASTLETHPYPPLAKRSRVSSPRAALSEGVGAEASAPGVMMPLTPARPAENTPPSGLG